MTATSFNQMAHAEYQGSNGGETFDDGCGSTVDPLTKVKSIGVAVAFIIFWIVSSSR